MSARKNGFDYVRTRYGVPAQRGMRVVANGKPGRITSSAGQYIRVRLDGENFSGYWHPTWNMEYLAAASPSGTDTDG